MNDEQKAALEELEGALAKCKLANVSDKLVNDTVRHSLDRKMSITLVSDNGELNYLWVNEGVEQSDKTLEEIVDAGIVLMAQHATRVNLFLHAFRKYKEDYLVHYRASQAGYIPKPGTYHNPVENLFVSTPTYGRSNPTSLEFSSGNKFGRSVPTSSHGSLWGEDKSVRRVLGREPFMASPRTPESDKELTEFFLDDPIKE